jgi:hypothetical protein
MVEKFLKLDETRRKVISDYIRSLIDTEENQTDKQEKIIYDEPKLVKMPARGGVYEVMETEEQKKAFKEDLKFKYEYDPNDF